MGIILSTQRTEGSHHHKECMDQLVDNPLTTIASYMEGHGKDKPVTRQDIKTEEIITDPFTTKVTTTGDTTIEDTMTEDTKIMDTTAMSTMITMDT